MAATMSCCTAASCTAGSIVICNNSTVCKMLMLVHPGIKNGFYKNCLFTELQWSMSAYRVSPYQCKVMLKRLIACEEACVHESLGHSL